MGEKLITMTLSNHILLQYFSSRVGNETDESLSESISTYLTIHLNGYRNTSSFSLAVCWAPLLTSTFQTMTAS